MLNIYNINLSGDNLKYVIIGIIIFIIITIIITIVISYIVLKWLKLSIDDNNIFFYKYNRKSEKLLDVYGNNKVSRIYLIRHPFSKFINLMLNLLTLYNYEKLINESNDNFPYHTSFIFEIELVNGMKKLLLLEKNNCINISENFFINKAQEIKELKIKKKYTIKDILNETQKRIGNEKFFNWHLYKNNCQEFTKQILKTIGKYDKKCKDFIFRDKLFKLIIPSEFTLHICNCLCVLYNLMEKYIYDI